MTSVTWARWLAGTVGLALVGLPAAVLLGLAATAVLAPKDFPTLEAAPARGPSGRALVAGRSGAAGATGPPGQAAPGVTRRTAGDLSPAAIERARARLLAAHSQFLRRERAVSAMLGRYVPTMTRAGRPATRALVRALEHAATAHARARAALAAEPAPLPLAAAHAATIRMLEQGEAGLRAALEAGRARDPEFALERDPYFGRALGEHYAALAALRSVPSRQVEAHLAPARP